MPKDAATVAKRWSQNLGASGEKIREGVQGVTVAPTAAAAASDAKYIAGVQRNVAKWKANLSRVSLADWQTAMIEKGLPRIATGASASEPKMQAFLTQLLPYVESNVKTINAMPSLTLEDSVNKAAAWIRTMSKFSYRK